MSRTGFLTIAVILIAQYGFPEPYEQIVSRDKSVKMKIITVRFNIINLKTLKLFFFFLFIVGNEFLCNHNYNIFKLVTVFLNVSMNDEN